MSTSVWDTPELSAGGEFVRFANVGDSVSGVINRIGLHHWDDGNVSPQLYITTDDGDERTVTAGQVQLKAKLAAQRPDVGDHITITYTQNEKRAGGKTLKHFDVKVGSAPAAKTAGSDDPPF